jgi:hypothetical protein
MRDVMIESVFNRMLLAVGLLVFLSVEGHADKPDFDNFNDVDQATIPADLTLPDKDELARFQALRGTVATDNFVNSEGRRLQYRYGIPDGVDITEPQPILIYFHGNNEGPQEQMLNMFFPGIANRADHHGLMPIVAASPETRNPPQEETRQWYAEDILLLHEFLQDRLPDHYAVDTNRIYFAGGSQGTCFLHDFMQVYGEYYGGGFYGGCGCYNSPDPTWAPPEDFKERMKVFINSSTGDFLLEPSYRGYAYYKYTIGLDTRGDLEREGAHCVLHWSGMDMALDWFTGKTDIPTEPFEPHWSRISPEPGIGGLALTPGGQLWMVVNDDSSGQAELFRSSDNGDSWQSISTQVGTASGLEILGSKLFLILDDALMVSDDDGQSFTSTEQFTVAMHVDGQGRLYREGGGLYFSTNEGQSWQDFQLNGMWTNRDSVLDVSAQRAIGQDYWWVGGTVYLGNAVDGSMEPVNDTPEGHPATAAWDGQALWAIASGTLQLFRSTNEGSSWVAIDLPEPLSDYNLRTGSRVTAWGQGEILLRSGFNAAWLSQDNGQTWARVPGLETANAGAVVASGESIFFTDGDGVFRFDFSEFGDRIFRDSFQ